MNLPNNVIRTNFDRISSFIIYRLYILQLNRFKKFVTRMTDNNTNKIDICMYIYKNYSFKSTPLPDLS